MKKFKFSNLIKWFITPKSTYPDYTNLKKCPACGSDIDEDSRRGVRIGECAFCGKIAKNVKING